jgi:hypothetical protein
MNDKEKMLGLMRFWLFGTFIIIFAATTIYIGGAVQTGMSIIQTPNFWISMVVSAILCIAWYFVYKWYLNRQG